MREDSNLARYQPSTESAKLICTDFWVGLVSEALTSTRYLFELFDFDALDMVLRGGLRACQVFADKDFQPSVFAFLSHISEYINREFQDS